MAEKFRLDEIKNADLLIFDYAPKLKIAGTFHSLSDSDKQTLEKMIDESDFVAVEYDKYRFYGDDFTFMHKNKRDANKKENKEQNIVYVPKKQNVVYTDFLEKSYVNIFLLLNSLAIQQNVEIVNEMSENERDVDGNDMEFCFFNALQNGKRAYMVDIPMYKTLQMLVDELSLKEKVKHIASLIFGEAPFEKADDILDTRREKYMLDAIEREEGCPISELDRNSLLVVGYTHAYNYLNSLKDNELKEKIKSQFFVKKENADK